MLNQIKRYRRHLLSVLCIMVLPAAAMSQVSFLASQLSGCVPLNVQFNDNTASATAWLWTFHDGTTSTLQNPSKIYTAAGSFDVTLKVTFANNTTSTITRNNYITAISPVQAGFSAVPRTACFLNNSISFSNFPAAGYDSLLWDFGDGTTSALANPVHHYNTSGTFTVTLIVYKGGCSSTYSVPSYITIYSNSSVSFTADTTTMCNSGQPVHFTSTASPGISLYWNFGDGSAGSTLAAPSHVYAQPGLYDVSLITQNSFGCSDTLLMNDYINILSNPKPDILSSSGFNRCVPVYTTLSANLSNVLGWDWSFGDSTYSNQPNPQHSYLVPGSYQIVLQVTYSNGCSNSDSATLNSIALDYADFVVPNASGCAPFACNFQHLYPAPGLLYTWDFGDGTIVGPAANLGNTSHTYLNPGAYQATLQVTNSYGCTNGRISNPIVVSSIDPTFTADDITGCPPHLVNFTHPGGGLYTYHWDFGDGSTSSQQSPSHVYTASGNYNVTLTITNQGGCVATYTMPYPVQVNNGVNNFSPADTVYACAPFTVDITDNSPNAASWNWSFGDGSVATGQNAVHTYNSPGVYNVSLQTQSNGTSCAQNISPYAVYVITGGYAGFTSTSTICPPYTSTFTDTSMNAVSWFWDFGDGSTSTLQNPSHIYANAGSYTVTQTITTAAGCTFQAVQTYGVSFTQLSANITGTTQDTVPPFTYNFNSGSVGATAWLWSFGDGTTSTQQNPVHVYNTTGPFTLSLTISNANCTYTITIPPASSGSGNPYGGGGGGGNPNVPTPIISCAPYQVNFTNPAPGAVSWHWDFGDGSVSTQANPIHTFDLPGHYTVTIITTNAAGVRDTILLVNAVNLSGATADFSYVTSSGCSGSTITTNNNSVNGMTYLWNFGDGTTSTQENPVHTYNTTGVNYLISLLVTDSSGCTDFKAVSYYSAGSNPISADKRRVCAGEAIHFSSNNSSYATYLWNFGNGDSSNVANPVYSYSTGGIFTVTLTVTDVTGCVAVFTLPYTIEVNNPVAAFSHTLNSNGCLPPTVQFTNQSTGANSYVWNFGNGQTSVVTNPIITFSVIGNQSVTLIAISGGCSDTVTLSNYAYLPTLFANFSYTQDKVCYPITAQYVDQSIDAVSWFWDFGDGQTSTLQNPTHVFTSKPSNPVTLTVTSILGCVKSKSKPNINTMDLDFTISDSVGCAPYSFNVTGLSSIPATWNWNFGNGTVSHSANASTIYLNNGSYPVSVQVTASSGCVQRIDTLIQVTASGPTAAFTQNTVVTCAPSIVDFNDQSTGAVSWMWNFGDLNPSTLQNPTHIYNQPGVFDVSLIVTDAAGCSDTIVQNDVVTIIGTVADFSVSSVNGCAPWQVTFADSSINASSYLWNFGDGSSDTTANPVHVYSNPGSYPVTLITGDNTGCVSVFTFPTLLNASAPPTAAFSLNGTEGCAPFSVSPINQSMNATGFVWNFGDNTTSTIEHPSHTYTQPGTYYINLVAQNSIGCSDSVLATIPVKVGAIPVANITTAPGGGCVPLPVAFHSNVSNADSATTYTWNFGNSQTSAASNPSITYYQNGTYPVSLLVTNSGGCSATFTTTVMAFGGDTLPPVTIRSASVIAPNTIELKWADLIDTSLQSYNIYRLDPASNQYNRIYTSYSILPVNPDLFQTYTDNQVHTADSSFTYLVQAVNKCGMGTPLNMLTPHTSVNLKVNIAGGTPLLTWNDYGGCRPVGGYLVQRREDYSSPWASLAIVPYNVTSYEDSSVYCTDSVSYRITALDLCGIQIFDAFSDVEDALVPGSLLIQKVDMVRSTVEDDAWVLTEWTMPTLAPQLVTGFELYRSFDNVNFTLLATLPPAQTSYEDHNVSVKTQNYYYRVKVSNTCTLESSSGFESSSILLKGYADQMDGIKLRWTNYKNWDSGVDTYVVERWNDQTGTWDYVKTVDGSITETNDR